MKTPYKKICIGLACLIAVWGCTRNMTDYRSLLNNQEITYPGKIVSPAILPGNLRLVLAWTPSPDPSVTKYVVYWNNNLDSTVLSANSHLPTDTVRCLISNLSEYSYTFFIYSYDGAGNRSVPTEIDNAQVYGPVYRSNLHNRHPDGSNISILNADGTVTLNFLAPTDTINITTKLRYVNAAGDSSAANLAPNANSITLPTYKTGTKIVYNSSYIPKLGAIDTFVTLVPDTIPIYVMCDKSKFKGVYLPHDLVAGFGTSLPTIWDGNMQPRGYPDVFHSDGSGNPPLPGTVTIDMGQVYSGMGRVEETGRNCCHNPKEFEVWGIADTTGAISSLLPSDNGWKADMTTRGWALLGDIVRTDDGTAPYDAMLKSNPPPVRYLIVRFVSDVDNSGYINLSQMTFWNIQ